MTEKYQGWLGNRDLRPVLEAYGATNLTEEQQAVFESLVDTQWTPPHKYGAQVRVVKAGLPPKVNARNLIADFRAVIHSSVSTRHGTDPQQYLGDQSHRLNLGYIQSQQENKG